MSTLRTIKIKQDKEWIVVKMQDLTKGQKFRVWEPDGTIVRSPSNNKYVFVAASDPYETDTDSGKCYAIDCEE